MTFNNTDKIVTVWKRGRLNALYWAIKATRQKVKDNLFCTRSVKKNNNFLKKHQETHYRASSNPRGKHTRTRLTAAVQGTRHKEKSWTSWRERFPLTHVLHLGRFFVVMSLRIWSLFLSQHQFYQSRNPRKWQQSFCFSLKVFFSSSACGWSWRRDTCWWFGGVA